MANIEQLVEQRCDEYRQRAAELEAQLSESEQELAAAQATIEQHAAQLAERHEDVVVLSDKLKFAEMDNYTKESAIADYNQRLKEQAKKLTQQGAVIAAMREALGELHATVKGECPGLLNEDCGGNARLDLSVEAALADASQLAADHDAAVRADERRKVLEEVKAIGMSSISLEQFERRIEQLAAQPEEAGDG